MKIITLKNNNDFKKVYSKGKSFVKRNIVVYFLKNGRENNRIGITTSKKIGNAVERNRAKRVIKECLRQNFVNIKEGYDFVIVARRLATRSKYKYIEKDFLSILEESNMLKK